MQWDKSFRVKVNAHELPMPEARKLNKTKKRGIELVRALNISDWMQANNYVEVEAYRASYVADMFRGLVVAELVQERDTQDIIATITKRQPKLQQQQGDPPVKTETSSSSAVPLSTFRPNPKQCSVCFSTKDLLRCSRCKNEWYCGEEHQREHWATHRQVCQPPTAEQEREREAFEKHRDAASNHSNSTLPAASAAAAAAPAAPGKTRLRMPARRVKREGAAASSSGGGGDSDVELVDDDIAEVDTIVSLKDSISQERIELAAKGRACSHLPCFDVSTFLQLSQQSGVWQCPICYVGVTWEDVVIDAEMNAVLREVDAEINQIRVKPDGSYEPIDNEPARKRQKTAADSGRSTAAPAASSSSARYGQPAAPVSPLSVSSPVSSSSSPSTREFPPAVTNGHAVRPSSSSPPIPSPAPVLPAAGPSCSSSSSRPPSVFDAERADYLNVDAARFPAPNAASASAALHPADEDRSGGYYDDRNPPEDFLLRSYTPLFDLPQSPNTYLASSPVPMQSVQAGQPPPPAAAPPPVSMRGSSLLASSSSAAAGGGGRFAGQTLEDAIVIDDD